MSFLVGLSVPFEALDDDLFDMHLFSGCCLLDSRVNTSTKKLLSLQSVRGALRTSISGRRVRFRGMGGVSALHRPNRKRKITGWRCGGGLSQTRLVARRRGNPPVPSDQQSSGHFEGPDHVMLPRRGDRQSTRELGPLLRPLLKWTVHLEMTLLITPYEAALRMGY